MPGHIHQVVQPVTGEQVARHGGFYGPALQTEMFRENRSPATGEIEQIAERARALFAA